MKTYKIQADSRVKIDLQSAMAFFKSRKKGLDSQFLSDYKSRLKILETNPYFEIRYSQIRCLPLSRFKYMIHFSVNEKHNIVLINAIISNYLNPNDNWL